MHEGCCLTSPNAWDVTSSTRCWTCVCRNDTSPVARSPLACHPKHGEIDTDECTSGHLGQNAFFIHGFASASLNQDLTNRFAADWYDPIVPSGWAGSDNAGPADYFGGSEFAGDHLRGGGYQIAPPGIVEGLIPFHAALPHV